MGRDGRGRGRCLPAGRFAPLNRSPDPPSPRPWSSRPYLSAARNGYLIHRVRDVTDFTAGRTIPHRLSRPAPSMFGSGDASPRRSRLAGALGPVPLRCRRRLPSGQCVVSRWRADVAVDATSSMLKKTTFDTTYFGSRRYEGLSRVEQDSAVAVADPGDEHPHHVRSREPKGVTSRTPSAGAFPPVRSSAPTVGSPVATRVASIL